MQQEVVALQMKIKMDATNLWCGSCHPKILKVKDMMSIPCYKLMVLNEFLPCGVICELMMQILNKNKYVQVNKCDIIVILYLCKKVHVSEQEVKLWTTVSHLGMKNKEDSSLKLEISTTS